MSRSPLIDILFFPVLSYHNYHVLSISDLYCSLSPSHHYSQWLPLLADFNEIQLSNSICYLVITFPQCSLINLSLSWPPGSEDDHTEVQLTPGRLLAVPANTVFNSSSPCSHGYNRRTSCGRFISRSRTIAPGQTEAAEQAT